MVCFSPSHGFNEFTTIVDSFFGFPSIVFISEAFPFYENLLLAFVNSLIKDVLDEEFLNRLLDKLSGCRETAYEGKTNDVGAKKQKEQKEQRNKGENKRKQKCKRKKQKK